MFLPLAGECRFNNIANICNKEKSPGIFVKTLRMTPYAHFQVHIRILCLYYDMCPCFNVQKALYFSHTACGAAPLFTLCLQPEPSLL